MTKPIDVTLTPPTSETLDGLKIYPSKCFDDYSIINLNGELIGTIGYVERIGKFRVSFNKESALYSPSIEFYSYMSAFDFVVSYLKRLGY